MKTIDGYKPKDGAITATETVELSDLDQYLYWSAQIISTNNSSANFSMQLWISNDGDNWTASGSPTVINSNTSFFVSQTDITYKYAKFVFTRTGGSFNCLMIIHARGN